MGRQLEGRSDRRQRIATIGSTNGMAASVTRKKAMATPVREGVYDARDGSTLASAVAVAVT